MALLREMALSAPRRLLTRLRQVMASDAAPLEELTRLLAAELVSEVCSIYVMRPGEVLELAATHGLNPSAVGRTRLRVGEGIVGLCAATQEVMNLADAQNHPAFAYRPETGEEPFASLIAVPVRRAGRVVGVLVTQNRTPRSYTEDEIDVLETVTMLLAELLAASGATRGAEEGVAATVPRVFSGAGLSGGIILGPIVVHGGQPTVRRLLADDPAAEQERLSAAAARMQRGLDELIEAGLPGGGAAGAATREVLSAYRLVAADAGWLRRVDEVIRTGITAEAAVLRIAGEVRDRMRRITDPYLRERLADLDEMAGRLLKALTGDAPTEVVPPGGILLARRLGPADLLDWHARGIAGVVIEEASPTGHAAIVARAIGLPALGGARDVVEAAQQDDTAVLDADEGRLILRPDAEVSQVYARALQTRSARQAEWAVYRDRPAVTADGTGVTLMLNVGLGLELDQLDATGAAGIGLYRSEIAMLARGAVAEVAEQAATYARVLDAAAGRPVLFRTLDLGADKVLPGGASQVEENPAMGWRSLRVGLDRPVLLRRQLRALLLAAGSRDLSVMFPMVATVAEFRAARMLLEAEANRVRPAPRSLRIGTMLEVPALMWQLRALLEQVDFVSIGSNDLLQFVFAADRGTPAIANRYDLLSQPMFDLLEQVLESARAARGGQGVPVSLCGEAAGKPLEAMALVGLGITSLSMAASGILPVKAMLAQLDLSAFRPVLAAIRRAGSGGASLREPILSWAREQGLSV
ncbi:MAG TPA: putative PEP-binding protein [Acetobacteraceae bacterium]|jgi:phosphotransferase system enzyme I (PtsP)|nr:putative PEP-binding protein [Acetobacteraceae bacterium]